MAALFEPVVDERLEQLESHFLRQSALMQLQLRSDNDDRAPRIIDALAQQILAETSLFSFQCIRQRLQWTVIRPAQNAAAAAVVEESIDGFLEHAFFVSDNDVRRMQLHQLLQTVVPVDDAAIKIVQIRCRESSTV